MNHHEFSRVSLTRLACLLGCLLPALPAAAANPGLGAAGFESSSNVLVFSAVTDQALRRIDLATGSTSAVATLNVAETFSRPTLAVQPGADRAILFDPNALAETPPAPFLFDVSTSGASPITPAGSLYSASMAAAFGPLGQPFVLLSQQPTAGETVAEILQGPATPGGTWTPVASSNSSELLGCNLALVVTSAVQPVGFCDSSPVSVGSGGLLVIGQPVLAGPLDAIAGVTGPGGPVFYAAAGDPNGTFEDLDQVTLGTSGNWTFSPVAELTVVPQQVVAMDASHFAVVANGLITVYTNSSGTWTGVVAGPLVDESDVVSAFGPNRMLAASFDLTIYTNGPGGWTADDRGTIGVESYGDGMGGAVCTLAPAVTLLSPMLLVWFLPPFYLMLRRRSSGAA